MYREHIVAFVDLLGFSQSIQDNSFSEMNSVVDEFIKHVKSFDDFNSSMLHYNVEANYKITLKERYAKLSFFSDCVVWSYPVDKLGSDFAIALESIVLAFSHLQYELYEKGIVLRGGISIGDFYSDENKVFGKGLVNAVKLEKVANYPRIVIDTDVIEKCLLPITAYKYLNKSLTLDNGEGENKEAEFYYIDLIKEIEETIKSSNTLEGHMLRGLLDRGLLAKKIGAILNILKIGVKHKDKKVLSKYEWLVKKFSIAMETLKEFNSIK